ncbi:hypothetical protein L798_13772 [Zootermopsis nevadensis]|uniref:CCHC-type domain-containing protein n=1 Tax=Zootermopsis nevadensis TaxID=136037 RepID=A0A067R3M3_ZOONE|nr:hypothetical protein L798_13772 [Zootermopsis nevadensis]
MPQTWIQRLTMEQAIQMAEQLNVPAGDSLEEIRARLMDKWAEIETILPSSSEVQVKLEKVTPVSAAANSLVDTALMQVNSDAAVGKMRSRVVSDLVKNVPLLLNTDPEDILKFLIQLKEVHDLKLVSDFEFLSLIVGRTSGRVAQIIGKYLVGKPEWGTFRSELIATFFPPRIRERFLASYVLDRFQAANEELNQYLMAVVAAADILGYGGPEPLLVNRILQNLHPSVRSYLQFSDKPTSIGELFSLATTVAEAVAVEKQRDTAGRLTSSSRPNPKVVPVTCSMVITSPGRSLTSRVTYRCGGIGHIVRNCPSTPVSGNVDPRSQGNAEGVRPRQARRLETGRQ